MYAKPVLEFLVSVFGKKDLEYFIEKLAAVILNYARNFEMRGFSKTAHKMKWFIRGRIFLLLQYYTYIYI